MKSIRDMKRNIEIKESEVKDKIYEGKVNKEKSMYPM